MYALARGLRDAGLRDSDTVAVMLPNSREFVELYGAAVVSGLTFVALNWHLGADELAYILTDSNARVFVTHERFAEPAREAAERVRLDESMRFAVGHAAGFRPLRELAGAESRAPMDDPPVPGRIMFYTSGTTGHPKGVRKQPVDLTGTPLALISGIGLGAAAFGALASVDPARRVDLVCGPMYHAAPVAAACSALDSGALLVMMERFEPERFLEFVARYRVTNVMMVPTMFHRLLALPEDVRARADVSSLEAVSHAGAPCPVDVKR